MDEQSLKTIFLLAENERAVARLYESFSGKNEANEEFWKDLAKEELEHASWIEQFRVGVEEGTVHVKKRRFPIETIEGSIETINGLIERAENNALSLSEYSEQLEVAHELEKGLIEKKFFRSFKTDSDLLGALLKKLKDATEEHQKRIHSEWKKNK